MGKAENTSLGELHGFINNTSLLAEVHIQERVFLFTGDISAPEWEKGNIAHADVVKLPHHGHSDAINEAIIQELNPKYAVISVSNTRADNCPDPQIIEMLQKAGAYILFTDAVGRANYPANSKYYAIIFRIDEGKILSVAF
jgi:beta-lactamase superfamily II metal-dependent hydrolase